MCAGVSPLRIEKDKTRQRENRRSDALSARTPPTTEAGDEHGLGNYEALLLGYGEPEVVASVEALLRAIADRLERRRVRPSGRKR